MIVVASANGAIGIDGVWGEVEHGLDVIGTVERAAWFVEDNREDHSVGTGGLPNLKGEVELDASIMEGATRRAGAVAGLKGYRHPISVARAVMEKLPHVLIVGEGAAEFAKEIGAEKADLLTPESKKVWQDGFDKLPDGLAGEVLSRARAMTSDPEKAVGTVNFLALGASGEMASSVSTSGWAWKWPGRAGDSPIIGAGNYCDARYGAAACTGFGELSIRASTARTIVNYLSQGATPSEAGRQALLDLALLGEPSDSLIMHCVVLSADGRHAGLSTRRETSYAWRDTNSGATQIVARELVEI